MTYAATFLMGLIAGFIVNQAINYAKRQDVYNLGYSDGFLQGRIEWFRNRVHYLKSNDLNEEEDNNG